LSIERPRSFKVPLAEHSSVELPGNPSSKLLKHSSGEVWHHSSGELLNPGNGKSDDGLKSDDLPLELSLALTKKQKRRWKLTGLRNRAMTLLAVVCRLKTSQLADLIISSIVIDGNKAVLSTELTSLVIPNLIRTAVLEYLMARHERQFGSEYLFVNSRGGPLSVRTVQYGIKRYLKDCGNPDGISSTSKARKKYDELMSVKLTAGLLRKLVGI
jgi:integrase